MSSHQLNLYIPRVSSNTTEEIIKYAFYNLRVGIVEYADFVATKHPETKEVQYYSAFVKLASWVPEMKPIYEFNKNSSYKMYLGQLGQYGSGDPNEKFWVLLPNKNPLQRTKVNVHQLAASTDKLFDQNESFTADLLKKDEEIKVLNERVTRQNEMIEEIQFQLDFERTENAAKNHEIMYLIKELQAHVQYGSRTPPKSPPAIRRIQSVDSYDSAEDDCIYSRPAKAFKFDSPPRLSREEQIKYPERPASVSPTSLEENTRYTVSRDFCGNI